MFCKLMFRLLRASRFTLVALSVVELKGGLEVYR